MLSEADIPLAHFDECEKEGYHVTKNSVNFNGVGVDGHENLLITREYKDLFGYNENGSGCFWFCKTAYKPYDKYVVATLILFKYYFGDKIELSSDGEANEWQEGRKLVEELGIDIADIKDSELEVGDGILIQFGKKKEKKDAPVIQKPSMTVSLSKDDLRKYYQEFCD